MFRTLLAKGLCSDETEDAEGEGDGDIDGMKVSYKTQHDWVSLVVQRWVILLLYVNDTTAVVLLLLHTGVHIGVLERTPGSVCLYCCKLYVSYILLPAAAFDYSNEQLDLKALLVVCSLSWFLTAAGRIDGLSCWSSFFS